MGLGIAAVQNTLELHNLGYFKNSKSVLEIGSQELQLKKEDLKQLFDNNAQKYDLTKSQQKSLKTFCKSEKKEQRFKVINRYNTKYLKILEQDDKKEDKSSTIYLNITPKLYNQFKTKEEFYNALFSFIKIICSAR